MALPPEREAPILRYNHVEQCWIGTIARQVAPPCLSTTASCCSASPPVSLRPAKRTGTDRLIVADDPERVGLHDGQAIVATHVRSFDREQQIENPAQLAHLVERNIQAHAQRGLNRLAQAVPGILALLAQVGERGENLGAMDRRAINAPGRRRT